MDYTLSGSTYINITTIASLVSAIFVFGIGIFVYLKNKKAKINAIFALTCLAFAIWLFCSFMMFKSRSEERAIFWDRCVYIGVVFVPIILYHFGLVFTRGDKKKKLLILGYILSFIFLLLSRTDYFVADLFIHRWGWHTRAYTFHHLFLVFFTAYVLLFYVRVFKFYKQAKNPIERQQAKYIFIAFLILVGIGSSAYLPAYGIGVPFFAYFAPTIFASLTAYAIVKYRLMDIRFIIRRSIFYALLIIYVAGLYAFLSSAAVRLLGERTGMSSAFTPLVIAFIIVIGLQPLRKILTKYTDKLFYKDQIDYQRVLRHLSEVVAREINLDELLDSILKILVNELKVKGAVMLVADKQGKFFRPESYLNGRRNVILDSKNRLIKYFQKNHAIIITEELGRLAQDAKTQTQRNQFRRLEQELEGLDCSLCTPVVIEGKLTAVMLVGSKLSGDMFSTQDIRIFEVLAPQMAAALEKAKLYEEVQDFTETLQAKVDQRTKELKEANVHLQKLDEAKSEFLSITAHQLRTPLSGIKGYLSMLIDGDFGSLEPKKKDVIKTVLNGSERLTRLINVFLNISRIESGRLKLDKKPVILEELVQNIFNNFKLEAQKKKINFQFLKPPKKTSSLMLDEDKITDVINNLIDNSLKYTETGKITLEVRQSQKGIPSGEENQIFFSIKDTGIGISPEELSGLFDKFSRTQASERINTGGSGLGLYIAKKLIEIHGGKIWAESEGKGQGSRFTFSLPVK